MRTHYAANRALMRERRAKKFARMRAAKEALRVERANAEPLLPETAHVRIPRTPAADATISIRFADGRRFTTRVRRGPWGGLMPGKAEVLRAVACALGLIE